MSRIDAFEIVPCRRHALYSGPYSADEFAAVALGRPAAGKAEEDKMGEQGYKSVPAEGLGGVLAKKIERLALISLTDIARLKCRNEKREVDEVKTNAARRYVFALAALAEAYPRSTGSHRLRSGCELVSASASVIDLRGGDSSYEEADALVALYKNRDMLVAVAAAAKRDLDVPDAVGPFVVTAESLRLDFGITTPPSPEPADSDTQGAEKVRAGRKGSKKT